MPERVSITLDNGAQFGAWSSTELQFGLDSYSGAVLQGPFDHQRPEVRAAFQPLTFPRVEVRIGDELVITGRVRDMLPESGPESSTLAVTVYSLAQELSELHPSPALLPLEFNGLDLQHIATRLLSKSAVTASVDYPVGARFDRVSCSPDATIHSFIEELARQRGMVLSDTPLGALHVRQPVPGGFPVARLRGQPLVQVTADIRASDWFSEVTGFASSKPGRIGARRTEQNPLFRGPTIRSYSEQIGDTNSADVPAATRAALGRMVGSVVSYVVEDLPTWRDPQGELWRPNTTVTLVAPEAMVYRETELLIREVMLRQTPERESAALHLVLPGAFGGPLPEAMPWEE